jgi:hypothetical protein
MRPMAAEQPKYMHNASLETPFGAEEEKNGNLLRFQQIWPNDADYILSSNLELPEPKPLPRSFLFY